MSFVLVVDQERGPPSGASGARQLAAHAGKAAVLRRYPFTLILQRRADAQPAPAAEARSGQQDHGARGGQRHDGPGGVGSGTDPSRRAGESAARPASSLSPLPPPAPHTLSSPSVPQPAATRRVAAAVVGEPDRQRVTWVERLRRWCPIGALSLELVKFDTQLLQNAEISGIEYQQGELAGYEVTRVFARKVGAEVRVLQSDRRPLADRAHRPQGCATAPTG